MQTECYHQLGVSDWQNGPCYWRTYVYNETEWGGGDQNSGDLGDGGAVSRLLDRMVSSQVFVTLLHQ